MQIRHAHQADAEAVHAIHMASIRELAASHYTRAQLEAWRGDRSAQSYIVPIETKFVIVALSDAGSLQGFGQLDPRTSTVEGVYVSPANVRLGIGRRILAALESHAASLGLLTLQLDSSLNAVSFYARAGYAPSAEALHEFTPGVVIPCIPMRKSLVPTGA
jgi:putative acetyltransferase